MTEFRPNAWGVTLATTDEAMTADLQRWDWGGRTDPRDVALLVFEVIRDQTMASFEDDGDTVEIGLFEFEMPLRVSLAELVGDWIAMRTDHQTGKLSEEERPVAAAMLERLTATVAKLRESLD